MNYLNGKEIGRTDHNIMKEVILKSKHLVGNFGPRHKQSMSPKKTNLIETIEVNGFEIIYYRQECLSVSYGRKVTSPKSKVCAMYQKL